MPFVLRDAHGVVIGLLKTADDPSAEFLPPDDPEVAAFVAEEAAPDAGSFPLQADVAMIRVIEDVIDLLIAKNLIVLTDLPPIVQEKLLRRRNRRAELFGGMTVLDDEDKGLF
ncbi:hypothetical protein [Azospira restricta]|uniref:Tryptophan synthase subunit beta like protein n=1 Tax=Azospira restricta TaxID=404405 RepID=A0A974SN52_9RHOO|nr:hypothetical protein [Azospira restricta]QRJ62904.1 hypothetical protein IWH25_14220 [Azospira restricta]